MEDTEESENVSTSILAPSLRDSLTIQKLPYYLRRRTRLTLENNIYQKSNKNDESSIDKSGEEDYKEEIAEDCCQYEPELRVNENMKHSCAACGRSSVDRASHRLTLDAVMSSPPKIIEDKNPDPILETGLTNLTVNTKALSKEAKTYELEKFQKNYLAIFNQESIDGYEPRLGTDQDVKALKETFKVFGFEVVEYKDKTKDQIIEVLESFKTKNFADYGCIGVVVLTHGSFNGMLRAKDQVYSETEIIKYFRVYDKPTLITKPKLLIIQACRGTRCLPGVHVQSSGYLKLDLDEEVIPYTLPAMCDTLIVHSSYIGEPSTRDELLGSWFIQTLCSKINEMSAMHDMESILTEVKREVAAERQWEDYNRVTMEMDIYKQMPIVTSTLIRKLYLRKYGDESPPVTFLDASAPSPSLNPMLDTAVTPLLCQLGPCACFLHHFDYIKKCLTYFVEEHPNDSTARMFLDISSVFEEEDKFNAAKEKMAKAICEHLNQHARHCDFFKFLYFYKHGSR